VALGEHRVGLLVIERELELRRVQQRLPPVVERVAVEVVLRLYVR
jgi:hypothetical protein